MTDEIRAPHTLVVTVDPDRCDGLTAEHAAHDQDCMDYELECPGVTDRCRMWVGCKPCNDLDKRSEEYDDLEETGAAHGVEHQQIIDLGWCTPTDECFAQENDYLSEAASDLQLQAGRYEVSVSFEESEFLRLALATPETAGAR